MTNRDFSPDPGMPLSIFQNKYATINEDGSYSTWKQRVTEMMQGNWELHEESTCDNDAVRKKTNKKYNSDKINSIELASAGVIAMAGRHLQHGKPGQNTSKTGECFTNCSTAMVSFVKFWLLMKGSGVGRSYDSDIIRVDWAYAPYIRVVLDQSHPDFNTQWMESLSEALEKYPSNQDTYRWFSVEDSAEGWAKVIEIIETAAYQKTHKNKLFIFNFSDVRCKGTPIRGQQGRPASGPEPFMNAVMKISTLKGAGMQPWKQAMWVDHYLAEAVVVGGIRRSARIATKFWKDSDIFDFINIKRGGQLHTANNSVAVDNEFWEGCDDPRTHAYRVFNAILGAQYLDNTGEPGILNLQNMKWNSTGSQYITPKTLLSNEMRKKMNIHTRTMDMMGDILSIIKKKKYPYLVNPCGEIILAMWGGYCVIGEINLSKLESLDEGKKAVRLLTQALIRVNKMRFLYDGEVKRTNRIGVGITGIHEFAFKFFNSSVKDLIKNPDHEFWKTLSEYRIVAEEEAKNYSEYLGLKNPHTVTTIKPSGTVSKVLNVTEGAHPPAYGTYLRWVQFQEDQKDLKDLSDRGYPIKDISKQYKQTYIVGFPTKQPIVDIAGQKIVLAAELSLDEHYSWVQLLEIHWLGEHGNQVSYTVKYDPSKVSWEKYKEITLNFLKQVRCCSVMPQVDVSKYSYIPEEKITVQVYDALMDAIDNISAEAYNDDQLICEGGACPIEPDKFRLKIIDGGQNEKLTALKKQKINE